MTLTNNNSASDGATVTQPTATAGDPAYLLDPPVTSMYSELAVTVTGSYSAGAEVGVTGRVDVTAAPEPSTRVLLLAAGIGTLVLRFRRALFRQPTG